MSATDAEDDCALLTRYAIMLAERLSYMSLIDQLTVVTVMTALVVARVSEEKRPETIARIARMVGEFRPPPELWS